MKRLTSSKQLKRIMIVLTVAISLLVIFATTALAGGWHKIEDPHNPDAGQWSPSKNAHNNLASTGNVPYVASTNQCKACHNVHDDNSGQARIDDFKLLRDKSRITECNYCHDASSGVTAKKPYSLGSDPGVKIKGEHTLGSTIIPDSNGVNNGIEKDGLSCGSCHSVHGAYTLEHNPAEGKFAGAEEEGGWADKLLKKDPAGNGGDASVSTATANGDIAGGFTVTNENSNIANGFMAAKVAFCADCHNDNSNWDANAEDDLDPNSHQDPNVSDRPNFASHVQGPAAEGLMLVNGQKTRVAGFGRAETAETKAVGRTGVELDQDTKNGCFNCHQATAYDGGESSSFPHQSTSSKFLIENFTEAEEGWSNKLDDNPNSKTYGITQSDRGINKGNRRLASLDKVCLDCHRNNRGTGNDTLGVGKHF